MPSSRVACYLMFPPVSPHRTTPLHLSAIALIRNFHCNSKKQVLHYIPAEEIRNDVVGVFLLSAVEGPVQSARGALAAAAPPGGHCPHGGHSPAAGPWGVP